MSLENRITALEQKFNSLVDLVVTLEKSQMSLLKNFGTLQDAMIAYQKNLINLAREEEKYS